VPAHDLVHEQDGRQADAAEARPSVAEPAAPAVGAIAVPGVATPPVQRAEAGDADPLGGTALDPGTTSALSRRRGGGQPLPTAVADSMGAAYGVDFSAVRVHTDKEAGTIARSVQAVAFTYGTDLYFSAGSYQPESESGRHLLAHELAHVVQQSSGSAGGSGGPTIGKADDPAESQADVMADQAIGNLRRQAAVVGEVPQSATAPVDLARVRRQAAFVDAEAPVIRRVKFLSKLLNKVFGSSAKPADAAAVSPPTTGSAPGGGLSAKPEAPSAAPGQSGASKPSSGTSSPAVSSASTKSASEPKTDSATKAEAKPATTYPATIKIGDESIRVGNAAEAKEAEALLAELEGYDIKLSSEKSMSAIKSAYAGAGALKDLEVSVWQMKELRGLLAGVRRYTPILGQERQNSTLGGTVQGVTTVGRVKQAIDLDDRSKLDTITLGEYFGSATNVVMHDAVTDYEDPIVREGRDKADNETGIEATAIHEMAHGLIQPLELTNWIKQIGYWKSRSTVDDQALDAEPPPTAYGRDNAAEDLCDSVAYYFLNKPQLEKIAPKRAAFIDKVVKGWSKKEKKAAVDMATHPKGTPEPVKAGA
jgi:hypothetical protein